MIRILVVGAGQIGSRHLQGLARYDAPAEIHVVDPSEESLKTAIERYKEISPKSSASELVLHRSLEGISDSYDVALITTDSKPRKEIIEKLLSITSCENLILEKFLFTKIDDYNFIEKLLQQHAVKCWVNTARRLNPFYQQLPLLFQSSNHIHFRVSGSDWGLGCNGIHFMDLFIMICGQHGLRLDTSLVDSEMIVSKRPGYIEFTGTLLGKDSNFNSIEITSYAGGNAPVQVEISDKYRRIVIHERLGKVFIRDEKSGWDEYQTEFRLVPQSELTHLVIKEIIKSGKSSLPTYGDSSKLHIAFLQSFIDFMNQSTANKINECLLT